MKSVASRLKSKCRRLGTLGSNWDIGLVLNQMTNISITPMSLKDTHSLRARPQRITALVALLPRLNNRNLNSFPASNYRKVLIDISSDREIVKKERKSHPFYIISSVRSLTVFVVS